MDITTALFNLGEEVLLPLGICAVMPVMIIWIIFKHMTDTQNKKAELIKLAIENGSQGDTAELIAQLNGGTPGKGLRHKLLMWLFCGCILTAFGLGLLAYTIVQHYGCNVDLYDMNKIIMWGCIALFMGVAIVIAFSYSQRMMKKELDAEADKAARPRN